MTLLSRPARNEITESLQTVMDVTNQLCHLKVVGCVQFRQATQRALSLLITDETCRKLLKKHVRTIRRIRGGRYARFCAAFVNPLQTDIRCRLLATVNVLPQAPINDTQHYAMILAHETYHLYLRDRQLELGGWCYYLWRNFYFRNVDEIACIQFAGEVALRLNFPAELIQEQSRYLQVIPDPEICYEQRQLLKKLR